MGYNVYDFDSLDAWVADWAGIEATAEYGEFAYSNFNFAAAARIAEQALGRPFGEFVTERIIEPLGMRNTFVAFSPDQPWAERALPAYTWDAEALRYELFWTPDQPQRWRFFPAAFGLSSTVEDYARFMRFWLEGGVVNGQRLISESLVRAALSPQARRDGEAVYGFGWFVDPNRSQDGRPISFRHAGGRGTLAIGYPGDRGFVVYFTQSEIPPPHHRVLTNHVEMAGIFRHPGPDMAWARGEGNGAVAMPPEELVAYTGVFRGPVPWLRGKGLETVVEIDGGRLVQRWGRSATHARERAHLVPRGDDRFVPGRYDDEGLAGIDRGVTLRFLRERGRITALEVSREGDASFVLPRIIGPE